MTYRRITQTPQQRAEGYLVEHHPTPAQRAAYAARPSGDNSDRPAWRFWEHGNGSGPTPERLQGLVCSSDEILEGMREAGLWPPPQYHDDGAWRIDRTTFELVKKRHGNHASWAVWAEPTDTSKLNMGDLSVLDPDENPTLLGILRNDAVMLGLNVSGEMPEPAPFRNFHYAGACQDYKTRYAVAGTQYWGAYMTDLIKAQPMLQAKDLMRHLRAHPSVLQENVERLLAELSDLGADRPTVLTFGVDVYRLVQDRLPLDKLGRVIPLRHYSDYISPLQYREEFLRRL